MADVGHYYKGTEDYSCPYNPQYERGDRPTSHESLNRDTATATGDDGGRGFTAGHPYQAANYKDNMNTNDSVNLDVGFFLDANNVKYYVDESGVEYYPDAQVDPRVADEGGLKYYLDEAGVAYYPDVAVDPELLEQFKNCDRRILVPVATTDPYQQGHPGMTTTSGEKPVHDDTTASLSDDYAREEATLATRSAAKSQQVPPPMIPSSVISTPSTGSRADPTTSHTSHVGSHQSLNEKAGNHHGPSTNQEVQNVPGHKHDNALGGKGSGHSLGHSKKAGNTELSLVDRVINKSEKIQSSCFGKDKDKKSPRSPTKSGPRRTLSSSNTKKSRSTTKSAPRRTLSGSSTKKSTSTIKAVAHCNQSCSNIPTSSHHSMSMIQGLDEEEFEKALKRESNRRNKDPTAIGTSSQHSKHSNSQRASRSPTPRRKLLLAGGDEGQNIRTITSEGSKRSKSSSLYIDDAAAGDLSDMELESSQRVLLERGKILKRLLRVDDSDEDESESDLEASHGVRPILAMEPLVSREDIRSVNASHPMKPLLARENSRPRVARENSRPCLLREHSRPCMTRENSVRGGRRAGFAKSRADRLSQRNLTREQYAAAIDRHQRAEEEHKEHEEREEELMLEVIDRVQEMERARSSETVAHPTASGITATLTQGTKAVAQQSMFGLASAAVTAAHLATTVAKTAVHTTVNTATTAAHVGLATTQIAAGATIMVGKTAANVGLATTQVAADATRLVAKTAVHTTVEAANTAVHVTTAGAGAISKGATAAVGTLAGPVLGTVKHPDDLGPQSGPASVASSTKKKGRRAGTYQSSGKLLAS